MQEMIPARLAKALRAARSVVVLTGAGVSAESGIPTFRDAMDGLWAKFDPYALASPEGFASDPGLVARWYDWRRMLCAKARPNPAHYALVRMQREVEQGGGKFTLVTQNVDRLHQAAGSTGVLELHGSLWVWRCMRCGDEREEPQVPFLEHPPRCAQCGGARRPGVVWFGESLPREALREAEAAVTASEVFFSVGTSSIVYPAVGLLDLAIAQRRVTVEINSSTTEATNAVQWPLTGKAGELLPALVAAVWEKA